MLEGVYALELIAASAQEASLNNRASRHSCEWSPERLAQWIPSVQDAAEARIKGDPSAIAFTSPRVPKGGTRSEWLASLAQVLPLQYRPRLGSLTRDPARLLRAGYQILCREWAAHGQGRQQTGEALSIIGLGALGLFPRVRCVVCYRLAMPATNRCAQHSQTKSVRFDASGPNLHSQISSDARLAKCAMEHLGWAPNDYLTDRGYDGLAEEKTIVGLLWGLHTGDGGYDLRHLRDGLNSGHFPRVRALLPNNFCELNDARVCASLRQHIDPAEWVVPYWYTRVCAAEAWLKAAEALSPGRRHMKVADHNRQRVANANALLMQGMSKKDISVQLGISQSHLSHLLRRFN